MLIISLLSPKRRRSTDTAATRTGGHWNRVFVACLLSAIALSNTALALDSNTPDKEAVPVDVFVSPLPSPEEEAMLREQLTAELSGQGEVEPDLSPTDRLRQALAQLGMDPDDPANLAAARLEHGIWTDVVMGGTRAAVVDERYGVNGWAPDQFAGSSNGIYRTVAAARLANGDIVEVSRVQFGAGQKVNLGITKRNSRGQRIPWANVHANYTHFSGQYILYPNLSTHIAEIYNVHDVQIYNDRIYVLITDRFLNAGNAYFRPHLAIFGLDGSHQGWWAWCQNCPSTTQDGVAMDISAGLAGANLVILGRHSLSNSTGGFWTVRMPLDANGNPGEASFANFPTLAGHNRFSPVDVAFRGTSPLLFTSSYYVLTSRKFVASSDSDDYDPCLLAVGSNNQADGTFGISGLRCMPFDQIGSNSTDRGVALQTRGSATVPTVEHVWVLSSVARASRNGYGIWKMTDRADSAEFGNLGGGRSLYGGCGTGNVGEGCPAPGPIFTWPAKHHIPTGLYQISNSLAISGYVDAGNPTILGGGIRPYFSQQHILSGDLILLGDHSSPWGAARFLNITAHAGNDFLAVGWTRWPDTGETAQTAVSARLQRDPDRIFYNGFLCRSGRPGC